jgi:glycine/D-amino acid oxidase-like deaminating enzyme
MNSSMVVTEPLPEPVAARIGWRRREVFGDFAHAYMYAQRTADGRIALGGRGRPYRFGSRTDHNGRTQHATVESLTALLRTLFPAAAEVPIAHAWCGVLGVPRDWSTTVTYDRATGLGAAGGYVGSGLAATNLAGRTLADLVSGTDSELTRLPWVGRRVAHLGAGADPVARRAGDVRDVPPGRPRRVPVGVVEDQRRSRRFAKRDLGPLTTLECDRENRRLG